LRNLLTITRNAGGVNDFDAARDVFPALLDAVQYPGAAFKRKMGLPLDAQLVAGVVGDVL
jgi:hypothetical protein